MTKIGRNKPCPCGSGLKYKKCCLDRKPRARTIIIGSPEPLHGFYYDKDKMELTGLTYDDQLIKPSVTYSQIHYESSSGKEKVTSRIQDKVIPNEADLMRHLSSMEMIISIDTNTREIGSDRISVAGIVHCIVRPTSENNRFFADFQWQGAIIFRNCPNELSPEKFSWINAIARINNQPSNRPKKYALVSDHDLDNHTLYNNKERALFRDVYLPDNFSLMYGRGDGATENILNYLVKMCDKKSTDVLKQINETGYFQNGNDRLLISQIPVPRL